MFSAVGEVLFNMTYRTPHHQQFKQCCPFQALSLRMNRYRGVLKRTWKDHLPIKVVNEFLAFKQPFVYVLFFPADIHCSQAISVRRKSHP